MEKAKKDSEETVSCLARLKGISQTPIQFDKSSTIYKYPEEFSKPGHGHV